MKISIKPTISTVIVLLFLLSCGTENRELGEGGHGEHEEAGHENEGHAEHGEEGEAAHLSPAQFEALNMEIGPLPRKNLLGWVQANGQLEVPPQNEARVTAIIGANVASIKVIEGEEIKKGQVLAYLTHPNLTRLQGDYLQAYNNLQFLEQDYQRQKKLYEEEVGSGKDFQQIRADYRSTQGMVKSFESQLRQFGINPDRIQEGDFYDQVPVISPIDGSIVNVAVKTGQYVQPEKDLFEIINVAHIHAELMVFEKDVNKLKEGQQVRFTVGSLPEEEFFAKIYSIGKTFEQELKAMHVHAEIENKTGSLIPGMYVKGQVLTDSTETYALPERAISREGDGDLAFMAVKESGGDQEEWMFTPVRVVTGVSSNDWVAVEFLDEVPEHAQFALNNAYYLIAEMNKGEGGHSH